MKTNYTYNNVSETDFFGYLLENGYTVEDLGDREDFDELRFFEGDPNIMKIAGCTGYFFKDDAGNVWYYFEGNSRDAERILRAFFEGERPKKGLQTWDAWEEIKTGIAYMANTNWGIYDIYNYAGMMA